MSNPGFYAQQAAQQASRATADAARRANQAAMDSHRLAANARRRGDRRTPVRRTGRVFRWLFTAVFLMFFLAVGAFVVLSMLHQTTQ